MKFSMRQTISLFTGGTLVVSGILLFVISLDMISYLSGSTADHGISPITSYTGLLITLIGIGNILSGVQMSAKRSQRSIAWGSMVANLILVIILATSIALVTYDVYDYLEDTDNQWQYIDQLYSIVMIIYIFLLILLIVALCSECCIVLDPLGPSPYPQPGYGHGGYPGPYKY